MRQSILELRTSYGLGQEEMAERLGISLKTYVRWEERDGNTKFYKMYYLLNEGLTVDDMKEGEDNES